MPQDRLLLYPYVSLVGLSISRYVDYSSEAIWYSLCAFSPFSFLHLRYFSCELLVSLWFVGLPFPPSLFFMCIPFFVPLFLLLLVCSLCCYSCFVGFPFYFALRSFLQRPGLFPLSVRNRKVVKVDWRELLCYFVSIKMRIPGRKKY